MLNCTKRLLRCVVFLVAGLLAPLCASAQQRTNNISTSTPNDSITTTTGSLIVLVRDASGAPVDMALAALSPSYGGMLSQTSTVGGRAEFDNLVLGEYTLDVSAAGYETVHERINVISQASFANIQLKPGGSGDPAALGRVPGVPVLAPKAQKLLAKATESLRAENPEQARAPLDQAMRLAPGHPDVQYLYGVYCMETKDVPGAVSYWEKALNLYPKHYGALMSLGETMLKTQKPEEATSYLKRAIEAAPASWRSHALLARADQRLGQEHYDDAIHEAERAVEVGHDQAVSIEPLLIDMLIAQGKKDRAISVLQRYVGQKPDDGAARQMLDKLRSGSTAAPAAPPATPPAKKDPEPPA